MDAACNSVYTLGTQRRQVTWIDMQYGGDGQEILEHLRPLLEDSYQDKLVGSRPICIQVPLMIPH